MIKNSFLDKLTAKWEKGKFVCVGLDPDFAKLPESYKEDRSIEEAIFQFNKTIIDKTEDLVCSYKPQSAFYEVLGDSGWRALKKTADYVHENCPDIPLILDAKRGDIGSTNKAYVKAIFDKLGFDALTLHPYLGKESLKPFLERTDKGILVLVKTSNPGAGEFQDLEVYPESLNSTRDKLRRRGKPLYQVVAEHVKSWNTNGNCGVVVGATYPQELKKVRVIVGDMPILVPGIGAQGGDLENTIKNGLDSKKQGLIISCSRSIIFAPNPREAALKLHREIVESLKMSS